MAQRTHAPPESQDIRKEIMSSLGLSVFREFNVAFTLMSIIPIFIGIYVLTAQLLTLNLFEGLAELYLLIAVVFALLGFIVGRRILRIVMMKLIDTSVQLRQHEVMKSGFVANVAYELRPPLAAVQMSLKNMTDGLLGPLTDDQRKTAQDCHQIVERLARMATDLIDVTAMGREQPNLQQDVFDFKESLHEVIRINEPYLNAHRLTVTLKVPNQSVLFFGDRAKLLQAFNSLIDHAVRWSPEGGIITVELSSVLEEWRLIVSHEIASTKGEFSRALDTFVRLGGSTEQLMGLGLHLAKDIVELHHGRFWAEGQPGRSTRLIVSLPSMEPQHGSSPPPARP